jgi:hypothetical protein
VIDVYVKLGASREELVPFEKYAAAAESLSRPVLYGAIQSGITSGVASAVTSFRFLSEGVFLTNWLQSWLTSWALWFQSLSLPPQSFSD